jgi:hypothetical protein
MKVIFLDHDGVICLQNNWGSRHKKREAFYKSIEKPESKMDMSVSLRFDNFDEKSIKVLNYILKETDAEIVCSSDWRKYATLEEMQEYYISQGVIKTPIDFTPKLIDFDKSSHDLFFCRGWISKARCLEIKKWLSENKVDKWVAVDDLNMSNDYLKIGLDNFVLTPKSSEGIKQTKVKEKIINYL